MKISKLLLIPSALAVSQLAFAASPVADAGADQSVTVGSLVSPSGAGSSDADGDTLTYLWTMTSQPSGSSAKVNKKRGVVSNFTPDVAGSYTLTLEVSDGTYRGDGTLRTDTDTVTYTTGGGGNSSGGGDLCDERSAAFNDYPEVSVECDSDTMYITTETGLPDHEMMGGIEAWINRVPIPYGFTWEIPLEPTYFTGNNNWASASAQGPIAFGVNGVAIFHYEKRPDVDTNPLVYKYETKNDTVFGGELDQCGGHAGQGDDYHYHYAPVCLLDDHDLDQPIAFGTDGIPMYFGTGGTNFFGNGKYNNINNLPNGQLDDCNAYDLGDGTYVYYTTDVYPYTLGCHRAVPPSEVTNDVKALVGRKFQDFQPNGQQAGEPYEVNGNVIDAEVGAVVADGGWQRLDYLNGSESVWYKAKSSAGDDCWEFKWSDASGNYLYCRQ